MCGGGDGGEGLGLGGVALLEVLLRDVVFRGGDKARELALHAPRIVVLPLIPVVIAHYKWGDSTEIITQPDGEWLLCIT